MTVRKFLDCSTAHLTQATAIEFDSDETLCRYAGEYGWFVHVPAGDDGLRSDLIAVFAIAREHECEYVLFDRDAELIEGLPVYDW